MKRVAILPLDGYATAAALFGALEKTLNIKGLTDIISHIKLNDGVHNLDLGGPQIVEEIVQCLKGKGLPIGFFLDLKIFDVSATLVNVLRKYLNTPANILTVSSGCSVAGIIELRKLLPNTKLAMVSLPTDISEDECVDRFGMTPADKIYSDIDRLRSFYQKKIKFEKDINPEPYDLVVCSAHELSMLHLNCYAGCGFVVPGIRDKWMEKAGEHQKRTTGVREALDLGATFVVMGAQLTKGNLQLGIGAEESCRLTMAEIEK